MTDVNPYEAPQTKGKEKPMPLPSHSVPWWVRGLWPVVWFFVTLFAVLIVAVVYSLVR